MPTTHDDFALTKTFTLAEWRLISIACASFKPGTPKAAEGKQRLTEIAHDIAKMTGRYGNGSNT